MTPEQRANGSLATLRALVREQQLLEACEPLGSMLEGTELEPVARHLLSGLRAVRDSLQQIGNELAPVVSPSTAGAGPTEQET